LGFFAARAPRLDGMEMSLFANRVQGPSKGVQLSVGVNHAKDAFSGAQIGLVNVAKDFKGIQVGLINVVKDGGKGAQIGLVNVARRFEGASIGLVPAVGHARAHLSFYTSDFSEINLGLRLGTRRFHIVGLAGLGFGLSQAPTSLTGVDIAIRQPYFEHLELGGGIGLHGEASALVFADLELLGTFVYTGSSGSMRNNQHAQLRGNFGLRLAPRFGIFVGASLNASIARDPLVILASNMPKASYIGRNDVRITLWPGIYGGIEF